MTERSPVEILGAILDEVEGLRRTDPRSHLPDSMNEISTDLLEHEWPGAQDMRDWAAQALRWADAIKEQKT